MAMLPLDRFFENMRLNPEFFSEAKYRILAHQNNLTPYFMWQMLLAPTKFDRNLVVSFFGPTGTGHSSAGIDSAYVWSLMHGVEFNHTYIKFNITSFHDMIRRDERKGDIEKKAYLLDEQNSFKELFGAGSVRVVIQLESLIEVARANHNFIGFISPDILPHPHHFCMESLGEIDKQRNISKNLIHMILKISRDNITTREVGYAETHKPLDFIWNPYHEEKMKNITKVVLGQSGKEIEENIDKYAREIITHPHWAEAKNNDLRLRVIKQSGSIPRLSRGEYKTLLAYANDYHRKQQEENSIKIKENQIVKPIGKPPVGKDELYEKILKVLKEHPDWGARNISKTVKDTEGRVKVRLANIRKEFTTDSKKKNLNA